MRETNDIRATMDISKIKDKGTQNMRDIKGVGNNKDIRETKNIRKIRDTGINNLRHTKDIKDSKDLRNTKILRKPRISVIPMISRRLGVSRTSKI